MTCVIRNVPAGLGEPCFDKLEALLAHAMLSIPATKVLSAHPSPHINCNMPQGFEIGSGFSGCKMKGSEHNDMYVQKGARLGTKTNRSGGIQGGISNGESITFRVAFKPAATIGKQQESANFEGEADIVAAKGRHDPCVVPRAVAIVEAMGALVIADAAMAQLARESSAPLVSATGEDVDVARLQRELDSEARLKDLYAARVSSLLSKELSERYRMAGYVVLGCCVGLGFARFFSKS